ncbi:MAG: hypothetical protein ACHQ9S_25545 [Candidatus Binatia bacterium]
MILTAVNNALNGCLPVEPPPTPTPTPVFDKTALSIDDPASLWVVVNKLRPLNPTHYQPDDLVDVPVPYVNPPQLRAEASAAVVAMFDQFLDGASAQFRLGGFHWRSSGPACA